MHAGTPLCLVTGGAGFIGSHTVDALLARGFRVRILDNLYPRIHPHGPPGYLPPAAEFQLGDVTDAVAMRKALEGVTHVFHLAAYQDYMPDFSTFFRVNTVSTALLYELIVQHKLPVKKVVVASSQAVYGEGRYECPKDGSVYPNDRPEEQLAQGNWEPLCPVCGGPCQWRPTPGDVLNPKNSYGMSKQSQETIALNLGQRYEIPTVAMRYSIVQGPRQSFYNAYSGACRIFCLSLYFDQAPPVYEDGQQVRDYVNIHDVVAANMLVLESDKANYRAFAVGGATPYTVLEFAGVVNQVFQKEIHPQVEGRYRFGDTRHIFSDISALAGLGWKPTRTPAASVDEYVSWLRQQDNVADILAYAQKHMQQADIVRTARKP